MTNRSEHPAFPLPLLPLRRGVVFPGTALTLPIGRRRSLALLENIAGGDFVALGTQRDPQINNPSAAELHSIGTLVRVQRVARTNGQRRGLVVEGIARIHIDNIVADSPFWLLEGRVADEQIDDPKEAAHLARALLESLQNMGASLSKGVRDALAALTVSENPGRVADIVTAALGLPNAAEVEVLQALSIDERLRITHRIVAEAKGYAEVKQKIGEEVSRRVGKHQREAILRQQLAAIKKELGEDDDDDEVEELAGQLAQLDLDEKTRETVDRELRRLRSLSAEQAEYQVVKRYLELVASLPWTTLVEVIEDINAVEDKLNADHYGLEEVKKRVLEHLAVRKLATDERGAILCLSGPPGVGKTSFGRSVAEATGRPFVRIALGGVRDEAGIRGHRRTYVGAMPGRVIAALRDVKAKNPVILLDEVDKLGSGWLGSPEAALLELLDPEQNNTFTDHYLDLPFDLSHALFICTANNISELSAPLKDRMEVIDIEGYTREEKRIIARQHLVPQALRKHGLDPSQVTFDDDAISCAINDYTREAGVRQLNREIKKICRAMALHAARQADAVVPATRVDVPCLRGILGKTKFFDDVAERTAIAGVATGLAWTPVGGDILFVESSRMKGKGNIEITGQLGDVMKESARAALTYVRSHADELGLDADFLSRQDLHVHVPAGAVPKDGPSAGVTIFTALASLLTGKRVRSDTAMTGECSLRGRVLPVGGIKAKVLAAHRAGIKRIILPERNRRDLDDVPENVREALEVHFVSDMAQLLQLALEEGDDAMMLTANAPNAGDERAPPMGH